MSRFVLRTMLLALLASCSTSAYGAVVELAATGQFEVQGSEVHRSVEFPLAFLVSPSPFGRPVFITTGPLMARLLAPARITRDAADPEVVRVDTSGPQEDFLSVRADGENLIVSRDGLTMTLKASAPLLGDRTPDELLQALPDYRRAAARYTPDPATLAKLRHVTQPTQLLVVFGSWCPHCAEAVPRLLRVLQEIKGAPISVTFHGVPHGTTPDPVAEDLHVTGLPTAIVRRDGKELARMEGNQWAEPERTLFALVITPGGGARGTH
jgi:thiol-disulfide isomerase/thioredoxin